MSTNHYILKITSKGADVAYKLTYKNGKFFKLEAKRQKFVADQRDKLMKIIPHEESNLQINSYNGVSIEVIKKEQSMFSKCLIEYTEFYSSRNKISHRMNGIEGKALKLIISHLRSISDTNEDVVFALWCQILSNWDKLEPFYKKQMELRQINSNLNIILIQLKNGNSENRAANNANDLRESL